MVDERRAMAHRQGFDVDRLRDGLTDMGIHEDHPRVVLQILGQLWHQLMEQDGVHRSPKLVEPIVQLRQRRLLPPCAQGVDDVPRHAIIAPEDVAEAGDQSACVRLSCVRQTSLLFRVG